MSKENDLKLQKLKEEWFNYIETYSELSEKFWKKLSKEDQEKVFFYILKNINESEEKNFSYRKILFDKFDFNIHMFFIGLYCGFLEIHNALNLSKLLNKEINKIIIKQISENPDEINISKILNEINVNGHLEFKVENQNLIIGIHKKEKL